MTSSQWPPAVFKFLKNPEHWLKLIVALLIVATFYVGRHTERNHAAVSDAINICKFYKKQVSLKDDFQMSLHECQRDLMAQTKALLGVLDDAKKCQDMFSEE